VRNVSDKIIEEIKIYVLYLTTFFFPENLAIYEIMSKKCDGGRGDTGKSY
jgi:hypothetical protein